MNEAFLLTGGNIGDRISYLQKAKKAIAKNIGGIISQSSVYETAAWGLENQEAFLNQALKVETVFTAKDLLSAILDIEKNIGRKREVKYGPRIIDIDILFFNEEIVDAAGLQIPHPQMKYRRFVLEPLNEIASNKMHPVLKKTVAQLLAECTDLLAVKKIN